MKYDIDDYLDDAGKGLAASCMPFLFLAAVPLFIVSLPFWVLGQAVKAWEETRKEVEQEVEQEALSCKDGDCGCKK